MEKNNNIPKGWKEYRLEELLDFEQPTPYIVKSTDYNDSYDTPVLTAGKSFIIGKTNESEGIYNKLPVIIFDDFTTSTQFVTFPFKVKSSAMKILTAKSDLVIPRFIFFRMQLITVDTSTHKRFWIQQYSKIKVAVPSLTEQSAIVSRIESSFSRLDSGIATLQKVQKQLAVYRQAVLKEAFEGCGEKKMSIKDLCHSLKYGTAKKSEKQGKVIVLRMGNMQNGIIMWDDLAYTNDDDDIKKYGLQKGDVLFNRTNSPEWVGKTSIYKGEYPAIYAGYLIKLDYKHDLVLGEYLTYYLNTPMAKAYCNSVKTDGVNQSNINAQKIGAFEIPVPDLSEQTRIVEHIESRLSVCDSIEKTVTESLRQAEVLRQSILKEAFEGKWGK